MQLHTIKRVHKNKKRITVARGGKRGKTAGRGTKGQKSRAGHKIRPEIRDTIKRLPKLRGRGKNLFKQIGTRPVAINLSEIEKVYKAGETVSPQTLVAKGLVDKMKGIFPHIKVLGNDGFSKKLSFSRVILSESAKKKVVDLGGTIS